MSITNWEADKMLDVYIYNYLMKRQLHTSASVFQAEANVPTESVAIDAPNSFLFEWWSVFWDLFIARTDQKHSEAAAFYIKSQQIKAQEMQKQQEHQSPIPIQNQQMQIQLLLQRHAQQHQQCSDGTPLVSGSTSSPISNDPLMRLNRAASNAMATKMYEDRLKPPLQRDVLSDATIKHRVGGNVGQHLDTNHASLLKAVEATTSGQATRQTLLAALSILQGNLQVQNPNPLLPGSTQDITSDTSAMMRSQAVVSEGSYIGGHGSNQGGSNLTLKGWPLAGLDQLRSGLFHQNNLMQSPQAFNQLSRQQQLMLQAQQNSFPPPVSDFESRRLRALLNQNIGIGKDGRSNSLGDLIPNVGTPLQAGSPILPHLDSDMFLMQQDQKINQQLQQFSQQTLSRQHFQRLQRLEKVGSGNIIDGFMSSTLQGNEQASKHVGRKRKQTTSSGPANSSGTANTTGPSASSPSTPSTQTPGDVMAMPTLQQNVPSSKSPLMYITDGLGSHASAQNQLDDMERLMGEGSLSDNVESFLSPDDADPRDRVGEGFSFKEIKHIMASTHKVECCHFSSDGKLFATGGQDKKAKLWYTESFNMKSTLEEHNQSITDVRFSPSTLHVGTSSADKTVRVWDVDNPGYSLRTFTGHATTVMSLDFHPSKQDLICSCDNSEIRYWSIKNGSTAGVFKGGVTQMRFQPGLGRLLAAAVDNLISILDVETLGCILKLQGHDNNVRSVCWESSGKHLASLSDDLVKVWTVGSGSKGECIHELNATSANKFITCVFHPFYPLLVIGCHETLLLWNFGENKTMSLHAHDKVVSALAVSNVNGLVASASHDKHFKIWK
ncbi:putative transcription factor WD40-like family [Lupinus albus]|uniref:Putative transcription factor WD40-like family n=1 Tax=Lupinus albus TaxID=3870 RepID=A0A6A4PKJ9_LUPAL|nr:putative transcription factor WD40-like family [Lupinus albus]